MSRVIGAVAGITFNASSQLIRPADTTQYAAADAVANSTTAAQIIPLSFKIARQNYGSFGISRVHLFKTKADITSAEFRLYLYSAYPTAAQGDNAAMTPPLGRYMLGYIDVTADVITGDGATGATNVAWLPKLPFGRTIWGLAQARNTYTPASGEMFQWTISGQLD